jgi:protein SCO1/2
MSSRNSITRSVAIAIAMFGSRAVLAHPQSQPAPDDIVAAPPTYKANAVAVAEKLGAKVPFDAPFRTQDGKMVTLGDVLAGELPTILTFNYSDCPMLCSLQLNGLTAALPKVGESGPSPDLRESKPAEFRTGNQFRIVTIDLEPNDSLEKVGKMRERYIARLPEDQRDAARTGWTFLVAAMPGDGSQIKRVADTVGFSYTYIPERAEWAHPAALIFLSTAGAVTRYVYGIEFAPDMMRESIFKAGLSEASTAVGFMNRCYHYDPDANSHAHAGVVALRIGAAGFVILMITVFGLMHLLKRQRRHGDIRS